MTLQCCVRGLLAKLYNAFKFAVPVAILGFMLGLHPIFLDKTNTGIPAILARAFLIALGGGLAASLGFSFLPESLRKRGVRFLRWGVLTPFLFLGLGYCAWILQANIRTLFRLELLVSLGKLLLVYMGLLVAAVCFFKRAFKKHALYASTFVFAGAVLLQSLWFGTLPKLAWALFFILYLLMLGGFLLAGISGLFGAEPDSRSEAVSYAFFLGLLGNHALWYALGHAGLYFPAVAIFVLSVVTGLGIVRWRQAILRALCDVSASPGPALGWASIGWVNLSFFLLLLLLVFLGVNKVGGEDSFSRMYFATIYQFAALHEFAIIPFRDKWPLLYQPLLMEMNGMPIYLAGGLVPLRLFQGIAYFSFVPLMIASVRQGALTVRTALLFVFIQLSSGFFYELLLRDKPDVYAFSALSSIVIIAILLFRRATFWRVVALMAAMTIVINTKLVLIAGILPAVGLMAWYGAFRHELFTPVQRRRAFACGLALMLASTGLFMGQNMILRGNPIHPTAAKVFTASQNVPDELFINDYAKVFYKLTIPNDMPSWISTIDLNILDTLYGPLWPAKFKKGVVPYWGTRYSISTLIILALILIPAIMLFTSDHRLRFLGLWCFIGFYLWFGWIGDGLRYSTLFPCGAMLAAMLCGERVFRHRVVQGAWQTGLALVALLGMPMGIYANVASESIERGLTPIKSIVNRVPLAQAADFKHPGTDYLNALNPRPVVLITAPIKQIHQFGLYQPSFIFDKRMAFRYMSLLRPSHLLCFGELKESELLKRYPVMAKYLELDRDLGEWKVYRVVPKIPWESLAKPYKGKEATSSILEGEIERFIKRFSRQSQASR